MYQKISLKPFPNGWYVLANSQDLKKGEIIIKRFVGKELVLFRTESGKIAVSDAYCPHMGGHFGHGGEVKGESIRCPFHHFCFDTSGTCTATGYGTKPSPKLRLPIWHSQEKNGFILVYYDENGQSPTWEVPEIDLNGWSPILTQDVPLNSHPQETTENSVDIGHFGIVHGYKEVKIIKEIKTEGHYLTGRYGMAREGDILNKNKLLKTEFELHVYGLGYSFVEVDIPQYQMQSRQFVFPTPTDEGKIILKIGMSIKFIEKPSKIMSLLGLLPNKLANKLILNQAFKAYCKDVSQDYKIWENKIYINPPILAKGDGPVVQYRRWAKQFYYQEAQFV